MQLYFYRHSSKLGARQTECSKLNGYAKNRYLCRMYLYNVSVIIEPTAHQQVFTWLQDHLMLSNGDNLHLLAMVDSPHEGFTYCLQFLANDENEIDKFKDSVLLALQEFIAAEYPNQVFIFDSTMRYIKR